MKEFLTTLFILFFSSVPSHAQEKLKIEAIQTANSKIETTINSLKNNQRAWQAKKVKDIEKLQLSIDELVRVDIEKELEAHEKLQNWTELLN